MGIFDFFALAAVIAILYLFRCQVWKQLNRIIENNLYKLFIKPVALALPSVILACYKIESVKTTISPVILEIIDDNMLYVVVGLIIVPVITGIEDIIRAKSLEYSDNLSTECLFLLLAALDSPVDKKMDRFLNTLNSRSSQKNPGEIFSIITDPKKQLAEITRSIHVFFEGWSKIGSEDKIDFVTVVFRVRNKVTIEAWSYYPESQIPEQKVIEDANSLAANSAKSRKMVIIPDIEKERKKKKPQISQHCLSEHGSAICYPINTGHTKGDIPLVLRITTNKPFFKHENREVYKQILEKFKKRILIEYALSELKDRSTRNYG